VAWDNGKESSDDSYNNKDVSKNPGKVSYEKLCHGGNLTLIVNSTITKGE